MEDDLIRLVTDQAIAIKAIAVLPHSVVSQILASIKTNGLEKTLEDLREAAGAPDEYEEALYQGMLQHVKLGKSMMRG